ncbi:MAG: hypothetical protein ABSF44_07195 [Candidatus Bathyarchaeia archaeon]|jgi:hypothetical protein
MVRWVKWYFWAGVAILVVLRVSALIPAHVTEPNFLGYYSFDPLAPVFAILLWVGAGAITGLEKKKERNCNSPQAYLMHRRDPKQGFTEKRVISDIVFCRLAPARESLTLRLKQSAAPICLRAC